MSEPSHGASELDARLAEIDRRLRAIQADLLPERQPAEVPEPPPAVESPDAPERPQPEGRGRSGPLASVLERARRQPPPPPEPPPERPSEPPPEPPAEPPAPAAPPAGQDLGGLAEMQEGLLATIRQLVEAYGVTLRQLAPTGRERETGELTVSAGPFAGTAEVRRFVETLSGMESVRTVAVRGYEGTDRALLEVQLAEP